MFKNRATFMSQEDMSIHDATKILTTDEQVKNMSASDLEAFREREKLYRAQRSADCATSFRFDKNFSNAGPFYGQVVVSKFAKTNLTERGFCIKLKLFPLGLHFTVLLWDLSLTIIFGIKFKRD